MNVSKGAPFSILHGGSLGSTLWLRSQFILLSSFRELVHPGYVVFPETNRQQIFGRALP